MNRVSEIKIMNDSFDLEILRQYNYKFKSADAILQ